MALLAELELAKMDDSSQQVKGKPQPDEYLHYYNSEFSTSHMKQIDKTVSKWMYKKKKGSMQWIEQEQKDNKKLREMFE